ncbi:hypothetical protein QRX50_38935 [Amycolatopsis carbonis]|uniref:Uncharacterized protein n=1 Tax=Amycolatopsis carbonis TaxID=715471 RepID=A0A9Y2IDW6_9PSEU|nr:hypothetical protein [Amycolatopsis sp. 2-15]WIX77325.1 hypothetical protein QRX50_38935 [Amycolatopsis sp. 2-15]
MRVADAGTKAMAWRAATSQTMVWICHRAAEGGQPMPSGHAEHQWFTVDEPRGEGVGVEGRAGQTEVDLVAGEGV